MTRLHIASLPRTLSVLLAVGAVLAAAACSTGGRKTVSAVPSEMGTYKVGNPYTIDGIVYRPAVDESYDRTGIASWYGPKFHGKRTANGEIFDMNAVSAAHKTLPMPSMVRVTNEENGRSIAVRINDRGPFVRGRIIDLSRAAAQQLGFRDRGTVRVRVQIMPEESRRLAAAAMGSAPPSAIAMGGALPATPTTRKTPPDSLLFEPLPKTAAAVEENALPAVRQAPETRGAGGAAVASRAVYIQAGAFLDIDNAHRLKARLASIGPSVIAPRGDGPRFYRVLVGPYADPAKARSVLSVVSDASRTNAKIVSD